MTIAEFNKFRFKKGQQVTLRNGTVGVLESVDFSDNTVRIVGKNGWIEADEIQEVIKSKEYEGATSYAFGLNCSHFTFDRVD
jgi:hypothetical protein